MSLTAVEVLLMPVFMFLLMLGMGSTLSAENFRRTIKRPVPVFIGLASQYGWMPLVALSLALALKLPTAASLGLIIMGCAAGGPISNFFTYVARGDLALSISMTLVSTLTGFLMIPLMLLIYSSAILDNLTGYDLEIPVGRIVATLFVVLVPVALGILLRRRSSLWAQRAERGGIVAGLLLIVLVVVNTLLREANNILQTDPNIYLAGILLSPVGFFLGYMGARLAGLEAPQRRATCLETGVQNVPLALGIILISFPPEVQAQILVAPIFYGIVIAPLTALAAMAFRRG